MSEFPQRLQAIRQKRGLNKSELATLSGVGDAQIGRYERGEREPTLSSLQSLADALEVSADYLMGRIDDDNGSPKISEEAQQAARIIDLFQDREVRRLLVEELENILVNVVTKITQNEQYPESDK